jgi:hypothetical protein
MAFLRLTRIIARAVVSVPVSAGSGQSLWRRNIDGTIHSLRTKVVTAAGMFFAGITQ